MEMLSLSAEEENLVFSFRNPLPQALEFEVMPRALHREDSVLLQSVFSCRSSLGDSANTVPW